MLKKLKFQIFTVVFTLTALISAPILSSAEELNPTWKTDSATGWIFSTGAGHMGTRVSNYKFSSATVKTDYEAYVTEGIGMWGTNIFMSYNASSTQGLFTTAATSSSGAANAVCGSKTTNSNGHITSYTITIYTDNFNKSTNSDPGRNRTLAHEIGHAYGLGDLDSPISQIMYGVYSTSKSVTTNDINGMKLMTHVHTHTVAYNKTYDQYSTFEHTHKCSECRAYKFELHDWKYTYYGISSGRRTCKNKCTNCAAWTPGSASECNNLGPGGTCSRCGTRG